MYRFLIAVLFCTVSHAASPLPKDAAVARASQVGTPPEIIRTVGAGMSLRADASRDKRAPAAIRVVGNDSPSEPATRHMVFAALALIAGIAIRRYGVSRK